MNPFTYLARDLLTWEPRDPLPYRGVAFGRILDGHGAWQGSLPLADPNIQKFDWKNAALPSKTALFVDLQGVLVWGGIIWTSTYDSSEHELKIGAQEFGSYFARRLQAEDYGTIWEAGEDPMKAVKRIVEDALAKEAAAGQPGHITGGPIAIVLHPSTGSGQSIPLTYPATSLQAIDSIISTLSQMGFGAGFDFSWDVAYLSGTDTPAVTLNIFYPLKGRTAEETGIVVFASDTVKWTMPIDGTKQATEVTETGSGNLLPATASATVPGYPLLQAAISRTQVTTEQLLEEIALGDLAQLVYPVGTPEVTLALPLPGTPAAERASLALGEFDTGDRLIFRLDPVAGPGLNTDPRFPEGMEHEWRINSWTATPSDKGLATLQLDLGPPPLGYVPPPAPPQ